MSAQKAAPVPLSARERGVLLVLCGAIFLEGIDVAMLNVALPSIRADLGLSTGSLQWVMSAYVLGYGGFMLVGGATLVSSVAPRSPPATIAQPSAPVLAC